MNLYGQEVLFSAVSRIVAKGDGMYDAAASEHYFSVGASAMSAIKRSLAAAKVTPTAETQVLDYACGYGRVLRWLAVAFGQHRVIGVDADAKAVAAAASLGFKAERLDTSLVTYLGRDFDLIWVGSLLTHLPEGETLRVLGYLRRHLTKTGVLVFTTHGRLVEHRLRTRERLYNLDEASARELVDGVTVSGFGFRPYPKVTDYGISVARPWKVLQMAEQSGLRPVLYEDRGWAEHQDVCACRPNE